MKTGTIELPTIALIIVSYCIWFALVLMGHNLPSLLWIVLFGLNLTLYLSLTHEVVHGHPTRNTVFNRLLMIAPFSLIFPFERFRDTHLEHHLTDELTDPFDDPESWYYPNSTFHEMNRLVILVLTFNNTLLGRMLIGPAITIVRFLESEFHQVVHNNNLRTYLVKVWSLHLLLCAAMLFFMVSYTHIQPFSFIAGYYFGFSILLIRTYLEHQAKEDHEERTVIIEKCCPLAFLFLFNNLHAVHHMKPGIAWYQLPTYYSRNREEFAALNRHYVYSSYGEIFRRYFLKPKETIAHPFLRTGNQR